MPSEDSDRPEGISPTAETASQLNGEGNEAESVDTTEAEPKEQPKFGSLTPQEAGRRSAERRRQQGRERETEALAASSGKVVLVRCPVHVGDIMGRLQVDAKKGNTQAARELREWMRQFPADDETDISALDARTQQQVLARVLADIAEDEGALPEGPVTTP